MDEPLPTESSTALPPDFHGTATGAAVLILVFSEAGMECDVPGWAPHRGIYKIGDRDWLYEHMDADGIPLDSMRSVCAAHLGTAINGTFIQGGLIDQANVAASMAEYSLIRQEKRREEKRAHSRRVN